MAFHVDGREGTGRAKVLTSSAADALRFVHGGYVGSGLILGVEWYHLYGPCGAVACTVAALNLVGDDNAVLLYPDGVSNLYAGFLFGCNGTDGSCGTNLGTTGTFRTAESSFVGHLRLHQGHEAGAGTKDLVGTLCDAELAASAVLGKVLGRERPRRCQWGLAFGSHLVFDVCEAAIDLQLSLLGEGGCSSKKER